MCRYGMRRMLLLLFHRGEKTPFKAQLSEDHSHNAVSFFIFFFFKKNANHF